MPCYITRTGSYLPGSPVDNDSIEKHLGSLAGEAEVKSRVLAMNGITCRYYAQDTNQRPTHDVYELGELAAERCLADLQLSHPITCLAAGTTFAPLAAPGYSSILHARLARQGWLDHPVEVASLAGICSSAATALVAAIRAVASGDHRVAICVGAEHASEVLKASVICPVDDRAQHRQIRSSQWFMSVFLRFMLSDGAGAMLLEDRPNDSRVSLRVNWTHALSFANEAPLCMKLESRTALLSQDLGVLSKHLFPAAGTFLRDALARHDDTLDSHQMILPHMSSFFFRRNMERVIAAHCRDPSRRVPCWTNLATAGNTGAASIFVMLDEYLQQHRLCDGERLLLFVPESGQFNFVLISLTAVMP